MINKFIPLLFLFALGCSPSYEHLSWLDEYKESDKLSRNIASAEEDCFIDQFEIAIIKKEILDLEKSFKKNVSVPKEFRFVTFNNAESNYIKRFSKYITLNELATTCLDLPCVLNSAYGHKGGEEGYRIYHWFLTMGSALSTSRVIPGYENDPEKKLSDYLFPNKELKLLNMMSKTMPKKYRDMQVSTLHRFPDGTSPGVATAGLYSYSWSTSSISVTRNPGTIFLTKQNVNISDKDKIVYGYYNNVILHEHSHALDFTYGPRNSSDSVSDGTKWTDMSWKWGEVTNTYEVTKEDGTTEIEERTEMGWIPDDTKSEGFLRSYQRTSPAEDFADSGAHYIISPDKFKKKSPKKYEWYKKDFYSNYGTTKEDFANQRVSEITNILKDGLWETIKYCLVDKAESSALSQNVELAGLSFLDNKERSCLESEIENKIERELYFVKKKQYLGCNYLKTEEKKIYKNIVQQISPSINSLINKIDEFKEVQELWGIYRQELKDQCDPSHIYLKVRSNSNAISDYSIELNSCLDKVHSKYTTYGNLFSEEKQIYIEANPFKTVEENTIFAFSKMMKGFNTYLDRGAGDLVEKCSTVVQEELNTSGPVFGNGVYVNSGVLNCINEKFSSSLDDILLDFLEDKYSLSEDGLLYLTQKYTKTFIANIDKEIFEINKNERLNHNSIFLDDRKTTFKQLLEDKELLGLIYKNNNDLDACYLNTTNLIHDIIEKAWTNQSWPLTVSLNEMTNTVVDVLCPEIITKTKEEHSKEFDTVKKQIDEFIDSNIVRKHDWIYTLDNENNFVPSCKEKLNSSINESINTIISGKTLYFLDTANLTKHTSAELCSKLDDKFKQQLNKIKNESKSYTVTIQEVLIKNLDWQVVINKDKYLQSCMVTSQVKVDKNFISNNEKLKQFSLVSPQLISKYLASNACEQLFKSWEKDDLEILRELSEKIDKEKYLISFNKGQAWVSYIIKLNNSVGSSFNSYLKSDFNAHFETCKKKSPYMRYAYMKISRKKCLMKYFEKNDLNILFNEFSQDVVYHSKLKVMLIENGQKTVDSLLYNINDYLK